MLSVTPECATQKEHIHPISSSELDKGTLGESDLVLELGNGALEYILAEEQWCKLPPPMADRGLQRLEGQPSPWGTRQPADSSTR